MLLKNFYSVTHFKAADNKLSAEIRLNQEHELYAGHFPEQAVVPGVVQLQIVKELLEQAVKKNLFLGEVISAKYLVLITPDKNPELHIEVGWSVTETGDYLIKAAVRKNDTLFSRVKAKLSKSNFPA